MSADPAAKYRTAGLNPRSYMMLEQRLLSDVVREALVENYDLSDEYEKVVADLYDAGHSVFIPLGARDARNADHAYRQVVRERFGDNPGTLDLVAVAGKMWKPKPVANKVRYYVAVG